MPDDLTKAEQRLRTRRLFNKRKPWGFRRLIGLTLILAACVMAISLADLYVLQTINPF